MERVECRDVISAFSWGKAKTSDDFLVIDRKFVENPHVLHIFHDVLKKIEAKKCNIVKKNYYNYSLSKIIGVKG